MALDPSARYPGQIDTSDPTGYPYGKAKNQSTLGDGTGTPFEKDLVNDIFGFQQALLSEAGITPSGTADAANASEYMEAILSIIDRRAWFRSVSNWTARTLDGSPSSSVSGVTSDGAGTIVAVGGSGLIQVSTDGGITWDAKTAAAASTFQCVAHDGSGLFVAAGVSGAIQTSPDGTTWTSRTADGAYAGSFRGAAHDGTRFILVGDSAEIQVSSDGITWSSQTPDAAYAGGFRGVDAYGGTIVAVGDSGEIQTSPDGITWTQQTAAGSYTGTFLDVAGAGPAGFCAVGQSGEIQTSLDGTTWTSQTSGTSSQLNGVMACEHGYVAGSVVDNFVYVSLDGATWYAVGMSLGGVSAACFDSPSGASVIVGPSGFLATSHRIGPAL